MTKEELKDHGILILKYYDEETSSSRSFAFCTYDIMFDFICRKQIISFSCEIYELFTYS